MCICGAGDGPDLIDCGLDDGFLSLKLRGWPMRRRLYLIAFTPAALAPLGHAIKRRIEEATRTEAQSISVTCWDEDERFFDPSNAYPLNECIRKLHSFDGAIIILGPAAPAAGAGSASTSAQGTAGPGAAAAPLPVNSNVLIEIGASMARFGRNRVFLLRPRSDSVEIPSYFRQNNVNFAPYDDTVPAGPDAVAEAAGSIIRHLAELGQSAYYSDLPAFGLAHGYFNNFVVPSIGNVESGATVYAKSGGSFLKGRRRRKFKAAVFIVVVPEDRIVNRTEMHKRLTAIGLVEAVIEVKDGRPITFFTIPEFREKDALYIVEVPTNLIASNDAIEKIEKLWIDNAGGTDGYRQLLERREIANFFRYVDVLRENAKLETGKLRQIAVPSIDKLTLALIRQHVD
jgi:nucleotide-binding STING sensor domain-containing protein/predicted nucleotide-binding protein with TIR-like domain